MEGGRTVTGVDQGVTGDTPDVAFTPELRTQTVVEAGIQRTQAGPVESVPKWQIVLQSFPNYIFAHIPLIVGGVYGSVKGWDLAGWYWAYVGIAAFGTTVSITCGVTFPPPGRVHTFHRVSYSLFCASEAFFLLQYLIGFDTMSLLIFSLPIIAWVWLFDMIFCHATDMAFGKNPPAASTPNRFKSDQARVQTDHGDGSHPDSYPLDNPSPGKFSWLSRLTKAHDKDDYRLLRTSSDETLVSIQYQPEYIDTAMGYYKEVGVGGVKDLDAAKMWYQLASDHGNNDAVERLSALSQPSPQSLSRQEHDNITEVKLVRKRTQAKQRSERDGGGSQRPSMDEAREVVDIIRKNSVARHHQAHGSGSAAGAVVG